MLLAVDMAMFRRLEVQSSGPSGKVACPEALVLIGREAHHGTPLANFLPRAVACGAS